MNTVPSQSAMAFYHEDGLVPAWKHAAKFVGPSGRIGTMLDVVDARIASGINDFPWNTFFTTVSAEYFGYSRSGKRILIVAHGIGPMSTLDGILKAYSFEYKDKSRNNRGGRISQEEFWALEDGKYGEVSIVEFDPLVARYDYAFGEYLSEILAWKEPLMHARLGPRCKEYLRHHGDMAREYHLKEHRQKILLPYILEMSAASNCPYTVGGFGKFPRSYPLLDRGEGAIAHLLSTGCLSNVHHRSCYDVPSLANDIGCHEWNNGVRLLGVRGGRVEHVHSGPDARDLLEKHWRKLLRPVQAPFPGTLGFRQLMQLPDKTWFTQYERKGESMATGEPEFLVTEMTPTGKPKPFTTTIGGYHGFVRYATKEVERIKPAGANAYDVPGEFSIVSTNGSPTHHRADVQFYRIKADTTQRLMRGVELRNNFDLQMELLGEK